MDNLTTILEKFKVRPIYYYNLGKKKKFIASTDSRSDSKETRNRKDNAIYTFSRKELEFQKNICDFYSRPWIPEKSAYKNLYVDNSFKWPTESKENWIDFCRNNSLKNKKKKSKRKICEKETILIHPCIYELVEEDQCILCFQSLYKNGYICDLFKKIPLIKKQSELNEDHVTTIIGEKTRLVVHKKCYDIYTDPLSRQWELYDDKTKELIHKTTTNLLSSKSSEDDGEEDNTCGQEIEFVVNKICD